MSIFLWNSIVLFEISTPAEYDWYIYMRSACNYVLKHLWQCRWLCDNIYDSRQQWILVLMAITGLEQFDITSGTTY